MKKTFDLVLTAVSIILIALGFTACGSSGGSSSVSAHDEAWTQVYQESQHSRRPRKTYKAIDYTRSLYFDGHASIEQTQQRLAMILQSSHSSGALQMHPAKANQFIALAVHPQYRHESASEIYRHHLD